MEFANFSLLRAHVAVGQFQENSVIFQRSLFKFEFCIFWKFNLIKFLEQTKLLEKKLVHDMVQVLQSSLDYKLLFVYFYSSIYIFFFVILVFKSTWISRIESIFLESIFLELWIML